MLYFESETVLKFYSLEARCFAGGRMMAQHLFKGRGAGVLLAGG